MHPYGQIAGLSRETICVIPKIMKDRPLVTKSLNLLVCWRCVPQGAKKFWRKKPSPISARWRLLRLVHPSQKATPPGSKRDCPSGACIKLGPQNPQQSRGGNFDTRLPIAGSLVASEPFGAPGGVARKQSRPQPRSSPLQQDIEAFSPFRWRMRQGGPHLQQARPHRQLVNQV